MSNRLANETSPYLLQHKDNPVDWYPWGEEAFERARMEDKPIFLSIGYSACHWCHVIAHESFEDKEIAELLNRYFISIKVDKEERPDIDSVYMSVCQAFTGSGGWPTSIFMSADKQPFFAGTYFPKESRGGMIGLRELLPTIHKHWMEDRDALMRQSEEILAELKASEENSEVADESLAHHATAIFKRIYDAQYGGFGHAPKFPTPHNLLFLLSYYERYSDKTSLGMAEHTLLQMYRGGMFDHIGFGFCRYSTDKRFLVPHFEKMLYDNALLILAYCKAYTLTKQGLYLEIAEKTAAYVLREMTSPEGGFYSSQDADIEGEEGKFYLFTPNEVTAVLGKEQGERFNRQYDITENGNFEGKSIPNLLGSDPSSRSFESQLEPLYQYRRSRFSLHRDDKILTSWNSLMIGAMCELYLVSKNEIYLKAAQNADAFIQRHLLENDTLYVSYHLKRRGVKGFLDDYAAYILAKLSLYRATLQQEYAASAQRLCDKVITDFGDPSGGFYLYSEESEELILRPKETYDGAIPSGNSLMAYNLVRLSHLDTMEKYKEAAKRQADFLAGAAAHYPAGYTMFLTALLEHASPPMKVTVAFDNQTDRSRVALDLPPYALIIPLEAPSAEYPLVNERTTYYVCRDHACLPPTNDLHDFL